MVPIMPAIARLNLAILLPRDGVFRQKRISSTFKKTLNANDVTHISTAKAFFPDASGGVLGFWHKFNGYSNGTTFYDGGWNGYYGCLKKDANTYDGVFKISSNELFEAPADYAWGETQRFTVRLVQDIY